MKKFTLPCRRRTLRPSIAGLLAAVLAVVLGSCSGDHAAETYEMFKTVPAEAEAVVSADLAKIVEQLGGKIKDGRIVELAGQQSPVTAGKGDLLMKPLQKAAATLDPGAAVMFSYQRKFYMTVNLADVEAFKKAVDEEVKGEWVKNGDLLIKAEYAISGSRLWVSESPDPSVIAGFMTLSEAQSFLSCDYSGNMAASKDAATLWMSLDALYSTLPFSQQSQIRMAAGMLFDSPKFLIGSANFKEKGIEVSLIPMTADYKPAKCVIDVAKIDESKVASLGGNANIVAAVGVSQKLVDQIKQVGGSMGGALPQSIWDIISPLDGTMAVAFQATPSKMSDDGFRAVISTNGKQNAALGQMLETMATVKIEGNDFLLSKGRYGDGAFAVADVAKKMKDAWFGMAMAETEGTNKVRTILLLEPSDGSLRLKADIEAM